MSTIVVGDLHGRLELAQAIIAKFPKHDVVFVGDYVDSFTEPRRKQLELVGYILHLCETQSNVIALVGNHEFSYFNDLYVCSGFGKGFKNDLRLYLSKMKTFFKYYTVVNGWLVTHAGVSANWYGEDTAALEEVVEHLEHAPQEELLKCGWARGGRSYCGGPLWCDFWDEFEPINGVKQIFGHTEYRPDTKGIINKGNNYNVDCFASAREVLLIDDQGQPFVIPF